MPEVASVPSQRPDGWLYQPPESAPRAAETAETVGAVRSTLIVTVIGDLSLPYAAVQLTSVPVVSAETVFTPQFASVAAP